MLLLTDYETSYIHHTVVPTKQVLVTVADDDGNFTSQKLELATDSLYDMIRYDKLHGGPKTGPP